MGKNSKDKETQGALYWRMKEKVEQDNRRMFVRLINRLSSDDDKESGVLDIRYYDAANCLAAVLEGLAGDSLVTYYLEQLEKNMPLHGAARAATPKIVSVLLDKGFSPDLRRDFDSPPVCLKNALPLNVSLDYAHFSLRFDINHLLTPAHQIITLCRRMRNYHKIIRALARNTKEIKHEFLKYLKQGKVFEVGALLAIASDLIMSPSSAIDGENGSIGFKNITEMRQFLLVEMSRSLTSASNTQLKKIKKTLRLLEIFDRIGDKLVAHMPMWDNYTTDSGIRVASLIKEAAFDEKEEVEHDSNYKAIECDDTTLPDNYTPFPNYYTTSPCNLGHRTRKFSTQVHFPIWLKDGSCNVDAPLSLPTSVKRAVTKRVLSKKHASFTGAFAKAIRHLRYW